MNDYNLAIFTFINSGAKYYHSLDVFLLFLTSYVMYAVVIAVTIYMLVWLPSHARDIRTRVRALQQATECIFSILTTWVAVQIVKVLVASPRPFVTLVGINSLSPYESGYSFPSGHAAVTFAVATAVYLHHRRLGLLLYGFALVVAVSRIYVGVHYPIDVVVGAVLGWGIALIIHRFGLRKVAVAEAPDRPDK